MTKDWLSSFQTTFLSKFNLFCALLNTFSSEVKMFYYCIAFCIAEYLSNQILTLVTFPEHAQIQYSLPSFSLVWMNLSKKFLIFLNQVIKLNYSTPAAWQTLLNQTGWLDLGKPRQLIVQHFTIKSVSNFATFIIETMQAVSDPRLKIEDVRLLSEKCTQLICDRWEKNQSFFLKKEDHAL